MSDNPPDYTELREETRQVAINADLATNHARRWSLVERASRNRRSDD